MNIILNNVFQLTLGKDGLEIILETAAPPGAAV